ncbi:MAG: MFS transporter [bacterium]
MTPQPLLTPAFLRLVSGHFIQALGYSSLLLLPLYAAHLGATREEVGRLMATGSLGGLLLRPVVGWALDAIGRKLVLVLGTAALGLGMGLIAACDRLGILLYIARLLAGLGAGTLFAAYFTWAADVIPAARRTEGIALFGISGLLPLIVSPIADLIGVDAPGLRWFLPAVGGLVLLSLLPVWGLQEEVRDRAPEPGATSWRRALTDRQLWSVWWATVVFAGGVAIFMAFATVTAAERGMAHPATLWFGYAAAACSVRLFGPRLPARVGPYNLIAPALGSYGAAFLVIASADSTAAFVLAGVLGGFGHGYCFPVLTAQVVDRAPARLRGAALAVFTALWEAAAIAQTPLFGAIADHTDDATMFAAAALVAAGGLAVWLVLERPVRIAARARSAGDRPPAAARDPG